MRLLFLDKRRAALVAAALTPLDLRDQDASALRQILTGEGLEQWSFLSATARGDWVVLTLDQRLRLDCDDWESVPPVRRDEIERARKRLARYAASWEVDKPPSLVRLRLSPLAV